MALTRGQVLDAVLNAKVESATDKCVLFVLDNYIRDHPSGWPSMKTIAENACCCQQTATASIRKLQALGLVIVRPRRRDDGTSSSNEYTIDYEKLVPTPPRSMGVPPSEYGGTPPAGIPPLKRPDEPPKETKEPPVGFAAFWLAYPSGPRKVDRAGCLKIWTRQGLESQTDAILAGLGRWKPAWKKEADRFVPLVATFLNQSRWETDPKAKPNLDFLNIEGFQTRNPTAADLAVAFGEDQ